MAMFDVKFLKDVCNDTGHARCIVQRTIQVEALSSDQAGSEACRVFCVHEGVGHWRDHADRIEVALVNTRMECQTRNHSR